ncbi:hypothetical protein A8C56_22625 [Niabella ginsenosidivorans]|uniref:Carbohydrate-binding protein SusD n=1 Tax=Niabella ginsenosidivorans TaxID=1176587 RepID=A0A1A9IA28_9BACT|nr:RagB/SusD family nutrient uptake outer membrane protein [Niabella ginsenosidivorans]ANH83404.1 hypothetical protein A8C56_22625 [Niabella ginsenosidivorans]
MKKRYNYILPGFITILFISLSCNRDFLNVPPQGQLTEEQALIDPDAADKLVGGIYNSLYSQSTLGVNWIVLGSIASDDADKGSTPSDNGFNVSDVDNFTFDANTTIFNNIWTGYYGAISRANKALAILDASSIDESIKKRLTGEAKFLRGLFYFNLVRAFGGVPKLIVVPKPEEANNDEYQTRASKEEIYDLITADLQEAVTDLPEKGETGTQVGRANKGAAQALLAKVYLYLKDWQKTYDLSLAVMTSGKYDLATDYTNMFREVGANNIESIFEVQTGPSKSTTGSCDGISPNFSNFQGPRAKSGWPNNIIDGKVYSGDLGFGMNTPSEDLANAYEDGDKRRAGTIIFISPTSTTTLWDGFQIPSQPSVENSRYNYKGYHSPFKETLPCSGSVNDKDNKPKNIRVIRFAEVLLMNAEAAIHLGKDAQTPLDRVRSRAGLTVVPATEANIWKERRIELAMESDRFFDIVREGIAGSVLRAQGKNFVDGKNEVFPIPQAQIDLSGKRLTQNPNY